jgi:hypothetical protein
LTPVLVRAYPLVALGGLAMKPWLKYCLVGFIGFGLGGTFFSVAIKEAPINVSGNLNVGVTQTTSSTFVANFQQRDMNALERRLYPSRSRIVNVDMFVKIQHVRPTPMSTCKSPRQPLLVDGFGEGQSSIRIFTQSSRAGAASGGANTQICVYNFTFVVPQDKVFDDEWALVVGDQKFPKMNQVDDAEAALASCEPIMGLTCPKKPSKT